MSRHQPVPVEEAAKQWFENPAFVAAYEELEEEVARHMGTSQAAIARIESGGSNVTTKTLQRYADALGVRLKVSFEPAARG